MFGIVIELLAGRYVAQAYNDREQGEWPPHPARLFSALVATWAAGEDEALVEKEREALQWLESQDAPEILASATVDSAQRTVAPVFVPVNDVGMVSEPSRDKLDAALDALREAKTEAETAKAQKTADKLESKLREQTLKNAGIVTKLGKEDLSNADKLISGRRTRQARTFPSITPAVPQVGFVWHTERPSEEIVHALSGLLSRLARLGHSSSMVRGAILDADGAQILSEQTERFVEDEQAGEHVIRWVDKGQLAALSAAFERHKETEPRVLPARFVRYREGRGLDDEDVAHSVFSTDFIVFARTAGPRLSTASTAGLTRQLRRALMAKADDPVHEVISGHLADGSPTPHPHLAIAPLPVVSGPHPDGALLGLALILPRGISQEARQALFRAIARLEGQDPAQGQVEGQAVELHLGRGGVLCLERVEWAQDRRRHLQAETWCRPSRSWATVTPIALDRNPGDLHAGDADKRAAAFAEASRLVATAVGRIGLPPPETVMVSRSCLMPGTMKPRRFPRYPVTATRPQRVLVHAQLEFDEPVVGPILLGAGRFQGLGLCMPIDRKQRTQA